MKLTRKFTYSALVLTFLLGTSAPLQAMPPMQAVPQAQSVYKIHIYTKIGHKPVGSGTGWIGQNLAGEIRVVTNSHVCVDNTMEANPEIGELVVLELEDGRKLKSHIWDPFADICILAIEGDSSKEIPLHLAKEESLPRDPLITIGHPLGGPLKATIGYRIDSNLVPMEFMDIEYVIAMEEMGTCLQVSESKCLYFRKSDTLRIKIEPGSSGSPVLNMNGEVSHMVWGQYSYQDVSLAVTLEQLKRYLK